VGLWLRRWNVEGKGGGFSEAELGEGCEGRTKSMRLGCAEASRFRLSQVLLLRKGDIPDMGNESLAPMFQYLLHLTTPWPYSRSSFFIRFRVSCQQEKELQDSLSENAVQITAMGHMFSSGGVPGF